MQKLEANLPNIVHNRLQKLFTDQGGNDYISVNSDEVKGHDALLTDLLMLGLDQLIDTEEQYPDDN
ncbi:hypothetical protein [Candidatus Albibeggiatoa sp. nov. BB20]|uniref:hypothetical protein n=1 Tax=Candidatus Albibeggiatoa sp. nov. BB20 TaxID=3162723 RepID=UPI00336557AC